MKKWKTPKIKILDYKLSNAECNNGTLHVEDCENGTSLGSYCDEGGAVVEQGGIYCRSGTINQGAGCFTGGVFSTN